PVGYDSSADFYVYNSHYKSDTDATSQTRRDDEAQAIRLDADALGANQNIIYTGDFNVYNSSEAMYQTLTSANTPPGGTNPGYGRAFDPIGKPGTWNNTGSFTNIHSQSPFNSTTATNLGTGFSGSGGGMD